MTTDSIPLSAAERWDHNAEKVRKAKGGWVMLDEVGRGGRHDKIRDALERRGLRVEVQTRNGNGSAERPWVGKRTWARTI